jgi:hypothetical protein
MIKPTQMNQALQKEKEVTMPCEDIQFKVKNKNCTDKNSLCFHMHDFFQNYHSPKHQQAQE